MPTWPRDKQSELKAFYGDPGSGEVARQLVPVVPPFRMYVEGNRSKPVARINFHKKAAPDLAACFQEIWDYYGKDQKKIEAAGLHSYDGAYVPRLVRGSKTNWSNHAFGAAIDLNAAENGLNQKGNMPPAVRAIFKRHGARWGGDYRGRKDPMHFEFCRNADGSTYPISAEESAALESAPEAALLSEIDAQPLLSEVEPEIEEVGDGGSASALGAATATVTPIAERLIERGANPNGIAKVLAKTAEPMRKSKSVWAAITAAISAFFGLGGLNPDANFLDKAKAFVTSPGFFIVIMFIMLGLIIYWRWADHGRGALKQ